MYDYIKYIESLGNTDNTLVGALESFGFNEEELEQLSALESYANDIALEEDLPEAKEELEDLKEAVKEKKGVKEKAKSLIKSIKSSLNVKDPEKRKKLIKRGLALLAMAAAVTGSVVYHKKAMGKVKGERDEAVKERNTAKVAQGDAERYAKDRDSRLQFAVKANVENIAANDELRQQYNTLEKMYKAAVNDANETDEKYYALKKDHRRLREYTNL